MSTTQQNKIITEYQQTQLKVQRHFQNLKYLFFRFKDTPVTFLSDDGQTWEQDLMNYERSKVFWFFGYPVSLEYPVGITMEQIAFHETAEGRCLFHGDPQFARMVVLFMATKHGNFKQAAKELFAFHTVLNKGEATTSIDVAAEEYSQTCEVTFNSFLQEVSAEDLACQREQDKMKKEKSSKKIYSAPFMGETENTDITTHKVKFGWEFGNESLDLMESGRAYLLLQQQSLNSQNINAWDSIIASNSSIKNMSIYKNIKIYSSQTGNTTTKNSGKDVPTPTDPRTTQASTSKHILSDALNLTGDAAQLYLDCYREIIKKDGYPDNTTGAQQHYNKEGKSMGLIWLKV